MSEEVKKQSTLAEAIATLVLVLIVVGLIAVAMFWPWTTEGVVQKVTYRWDNRSIITFDDGRTLTLSGQPSRSINAGKYYRITYNNVKYFYSVEEVEK